MSIQPAPFLDYTNAWWAECDSCVHWQPGNHPCSKFDSPEWVGKDTEPEVCADWEDAGDRLTATAKRGFDAPYKAPAGYRWCTKCEQCLPIADFYETTKNRCKECVKEDNRVRHATGLKIGERATRV